MSPATITFQTSGLLCKWGFGDGDMLDDLLYDNGYGGVWDTPDERAARDSDRDLYGFDHRVLIRVVREYVVPQVRAHHDIEVGDISTIHNPIRAFTVDGVEIDHYHYEVNAPLKPSSVDVPVSAILAIAAEESHRYASEGAG